MKNTILLLSFLLFIINARCQEVKSVQLKTPSHRNEIAAGYGYVTREQLLNGFGKTSKLYIVNDSNRYTLASTIAYKLFGNYNNVSFGAPKRTGALMLTYRRSVLPWLTIGITVGYEHEKKELMSGGAAIGMYKRTSVTLAPECQLIYTRKGLVTYYGFLGVGSAFITGKYTSNSSSATYKYTANMVNPQITPLGIKVGKRLSGLGEIGFGYKGILHLGLAYTM